MRSDARRAGRVRRWCNCGGGCLYCSRYVGTQIATQPVADNCPALSLHAARTLAQELPAKLTDDAHESEFDAYMFHAGAYYASGRQGVPLVIASILFAATLGVTCVSFCFLLDVYRQLVPT